MRMDEYKEEYDHDKVLVVGLPKAGKSTLVAQLASRFKLHWIDTAHGMKTLMKLPAEMQANINLIVLPDSASYPIAAETLMTLFKFSKADICHEHGKVNCAVCKKDVPANFTSIDFSKFTKDDILVLDDATQLGLSILAYTLKNKPVDYKPERDDWGTLRKYTEFFKSQFQALPCNFICITHIVEAKGEDGREKLFPAFGSSNMSTVFGGAFDHIVYVEQKNMKHVAGSMTNYSAVALTGSRTDFDITKEKVMSLEGIFTRAGSSSSAGNPTPGQIAMESIKKIAG